MTLQKITLYIALNHLLCIVLWRGGEYYVPPLDKLLFVATFLFKTLFYITSTLLISMLCSPVYSMQVLNIYAASVPVASQQSQDRSTGFDLAFQKVLIKASGHISLASSPVLLERFLPAEPFVQTFSYRENPDYIEYKARQLRTAEQGVLRLELEGKVSEDGGRRDAEEYTLTRQQSDLDEQPLVSAVIRNNVAPVLNDIGNSSSAHDGCVDLNRTNIDSDNRIESDQERDSNEKDDASELAPLRYLLDVSFAPSLVQQRMQSANIPVWGSVRPSVLLWVVEEHNGERAMVGTSDLEVTLPSLSDLASQSGLPIFLPVADLQDVSAVDLDDAWGLFPETVQQASARYEPDAVATMRIQQSSDCLWSASWLLEVKQSRFYGSEQAKSRELVISSLVSSLAESLASKYAIAAQVDGAMSSHIDIEVGGINSFQDYVGIQRYLNKLPPVSEVELKWVRQNRAALSLTLLSEPQQFYEHIELGGHLKRIPLSELIDLFENSIDTIPADQLIWISGQNTMRQ